MSLPTPARLVLPLLILNLATGPLCAQTNAQGQSLGARAPAVISYASLRNGYAWLPISDQRLATVRGGFDLGNGLQASFGIQRAVYVNGNLVTSTAITIPDIAHISATQAGELVAATSSLSVIQNGTANAFAPTTAEQGATSTVIQNSLNNQNINSLTTLNVSVNTLNAFRGSNLQNTLQAAQLQSLGR